MRILISTDGPHAHLYIRQAWGKVFSQMGHQVSFWDVSTKSVFDAFDEFEPNIFMGQTYNISKGLIKCIKERPHLKVAMRASDWGDIQDDIDLEKYPILVAQEEEKKMLEQLKKETGKPDFVHNHYTQKWIDVTHNKWKDIGIKPVSLIHAAAIFDFHPKPQLEVLQCDIGFVGGYWPYKSRTLDPYIVDLCHPVGQYKIKIFGSNWPVAQHHGVIATENMSSLFSSATVCPNVSEAHSQDFGYDIIERPFKVLSSGGFCISDYVESMAEEVFNNGEVVFAKTPKEFREKIEHYINNPDERIEHMKKGYESVMRNHTYFERVSDIFKNLGMNEESERCLETKSNMFGG